MLILMRKPGETICIGDDITITVVGLERNRVRIGISAPRTVVVDREEIAAKKRKELGPPLKPATSPA